MDDLSDEPASTKVIDERELFEHIVESSTDFAIFTTDLDGIVTSWNTGARRLFGYPDDEILGINHDVTFTPEDHPFQGLLAWARTRAVATWARAIAAST